MASTLERAKFLPWGEGQSLVLRLAPEGDAAEADLRFSSSLIGFANVRLTLTFTGRKTVTVKAEGPRGEYVLVNGETGVTGPRQLPCRIESGGDRLRLSANDEGLLLLAFPLVYLRARDIAVGHEGGRQLEGVNLSITSGQIMGLMGPSGCGKTTLLRTLVGRNAPLDGQVTLNGQPLADVRGHLGYVPQFNETLLRDLTVEQNLCFSMGLRAGLGHDDPAVRRRALEVLEEVGLSARAAAKVRFLSGGEERRLSIGVELLTRPLMLLLDEPLSGLSSADAARVWSLLQQLAADGCGVAMTVHQPSAAIARALDALCLVFKGKVAQFNSFGGACRALGVGDDQHYPDVLIERLEQKGLPPQAQHTETNLKGATQRPARRGQVVTNTLTYTQRTLRAVWARGPERLLVLGVPAVMGVLMAVTFLTPRLAGADSFLFDVNTAPGLLFVLTLAQLWLSAQVASKEVVGDWLVLRRELEVGCHATPFVVGKLVAGTLLSVLQGLVLLGAVALTTRVGVLLGASGLDLLSTGDGFTPLGALLRVGQLWGVLSLTGAVGTALGTIISIVFRQRMEAAVVAVPLVLVACVLFSGFVPPQTQMTPVGAALSAIDPSRLSLQAALAVELRNTPDQLRNWCGIASGDDEKWLRSMSDDGGRASRFDWRVQTCILYLHLGTANSLDLQGRDELAQRHYFGVFLDERRALAALAVATIAYMAVCLLLFWWHIGRRHYLS